MPLCRAVLIALAQTKFLTELIVSWAMLLVSIPLAALVLWHCRDTNYGVEKVVHVEDVMDSQMHGAAVPKGHHTEVQPVIATEQKPALEAKEHEATAGV